MHLVHLTLPGPGGGLRSPWGAVMLRAVVCCSDQGHADGLLFVPSIERSRRSRRRRAAPDGCPPDSSIMATRAEKKDDHTNLYEAVWWWWHLEGGGGTVYQHTDKFINMLVLLLLFVSLLPLEPPVCSVFVFKAKWGESGEKTWFSQISSESRSIFTEKALVSEAKW